MKKIGAVIAALLIISLACGGYYYVSHQNKGSGENTVELTEVQKIITKDLKKDYPATPRAVVKLYNRIMTCYYDAEYSEEEFDSLTEQAQMLFDDELKEANPIDSYKASVKAEVQQYVQAKKIISQSKVCGSNEVEYKTVKKDKCAYVKTSYFVREGKSKYSKTYEEYVLRQDKEGNWKILGYYMTKGASSEDD